jgi:hypothetical protein
VSRRVPAPSGADAFGAPSSATRDWIGQPRTARPILASARRPPCSQSQFEQDRYLWRQLEWWARLILDDRLLSVRRKEDAALLQDILILAFSFPYESFT